MIYPAPTILPGTEPYWQAATDNRLLIKRCTACGRAHHYPRPHCPHCWSGDVIWQDAAGTGTVYALSTMERADPPYTIAYVTLDEGVTVLTNLIGMDAPAIGDRVRVTFASAEDGQMIPLFTEA